jgi:hypothetical protein
MKKRLLSVFLAGATIIALLSGCNSDSAATSETPNTPDSDVSQVTETEIPQVSESPDYEKYAGTWAQEGSNWLAGGITLDVSVDADTISVAYMEITAAPISMEAEVDVSFPVADIKDNAISVDFENDGWGNGGTLGITFLDDEILCDVSNVYFAGDEGYSVWEVTTQSTSLTEMENAHELMYYTMDDYYEMFPEENPDNQQDEPNTSTASGILAALGMTEEEFRANCQPLESTYTVKQSKLTLRQLREYPADYIGQWFYTSSGSDNYQPSRIGVSSKGTSSDGYVTYICERSSISEYILLFDCRDDVYSPTISQNDSICPYMIFTGIQTLNGRDYICFNLISVDK